VPLHRSGRHPSLLRPDDTILIVTDMQEPFLRNIWERENLISNVGALIEAARLMRIPIVVTQQNTPKMGGTIPEISRRMPTDTVPFDKMCFSSVADDAIYSEIHRSGAKQIVICGVETHICVSQTAQDLLARHYQVHIAADAVSSRTQSNWEIGLSRLEKTGVIISSTEMAIFELLGEADTPEFRTLLDLMK
jgi:nicotinamidase-related amidase